MKQKNDVLQREINQKRHDIAQLKIEKRYLQRKMRITRRYEGKI